MKTITLLFSLFLSLVCIAKDDNGLVVKQDGLVVEVMDFEEGDKLKLFEVETGDHILSKSYSHIDLSQLPVGSYILENNQGQSVVIDRLEEELMIEGAVFAQDENFEVEDSMMADAGESTDVEEGFIKNYVNSNQNQLDIHRDGDIVTVLNFEEGDKLKLFEVKDTVHVLSKTTNVIDLSLLPVGVYLLENNNGDSVIVEKFIETQNNLSEL